MDDNDVFLSKMSIQTVEVFRDFITKPKGISDKEAFTWIVAGVLGVFQHSLSVRDLRELLEVQVQSLIEIENEQ